MASNIAESKVERMLTIYRRLSDGEVVNKTDIAKEFQVNIRSVQRDIDDLRAYFANCSVSLEVCPQILYDRKRKGYFLDYEAQKMSGSELLAVCKILLESRAFTKTELNPIMKKLLYNCSPQSERKQVEDLIANEQYHYIEPHHHTEFIGCMWEIGKAIKEHRYLKMWYLKLGTSDTVMRIVKPVGIMFSEYYFYLVAFIEEEENTTQAYTSPAIYRFDRISSYEVQERRFAVPYRDRFEEGEFRKRVQFMFGGKLQRLVFEYSGLSIEAVLDRLPTAKVLEEKEDVGKKIYIVRAEVFGDGIDMWLKSQGDSIKVISRKILN